MQEQDELYMRRALELARRGAGRVSPNPMVGCVIVKAGRVIGEGWHEHCGGLHAERNALDERQHDRKRGQQAAERQFFCFQRITLPFQDTIASISSVSPTSLSTTRLGRQTAT